MKGEILIIEDEDSISKMIYEMLEVGGRKGTICSNGREAVERILNDDFDLILLDVMLPELDGFQIIQHIGNKDIPVIFVTAMSNVFDKVKGLRLGAEDYITKPFETIELLARIEVVLRRRQRVYSTLKYQNIIVDIEKHIVTSDDKSILLTPIEFDLLVYFIQNIDIALNRERLLASVWGYGFEGETRTVDIHVQQLRKKLNFNKKLVTIPKVGYRLDR